MSKFFFLTKAVLDAKPFLEEEPGKSDFEAYLVELVGTGVVASVEEAKDGSKVVYDVKFLNGKGLSINFEVVEVEGKKTARVIVLADNSEYSEEVPTDAVGEDGVVNVEKLSKEFNFLRDLFDKYGERGVEFEGLRKVEGKIVRKSK